MICNQLTQYTLHLADSNLILTQRNAAWCGHGPILEQDIAITNITLDLIGQCRNFYQYAAQIINQSTNQPITEDTLAYLRTEREFKNPLLVEQQNGNWAHTIVRQLFYSTYQYFLYEQLQKSTDTHIAGIAAKSYKEVKYHVSWSSEWAIRLGDGTEESRKKMQNAINELYTYTGELFTPTEYELEMIKIGVAPNLEMIKQSWLAKINEVCEEATLTIPEKVFMQTGG